MLDGVGGPGGWFCHTVTVTQFVKNDLEAQSPCIDAKNHGVRSVEASVEKERKGMGLAVSVRPSVLSRLSVCMLLHKALCTQVVKLIMT